MRQSTTVALMVGLAMPAFAARGRVGLLSSETPIARVVRLLTEMKQQVEAEAKEDAGIYSKLECWCESTKKERTQLADEADRQVTELPLVMKEAKARSGRLKSEISDLKQDLEEAQEAIDKAAAIREKEKGEFEDASKDMMDTIGSLKEALTVLKKVQLVQGKATKPQETVAALLQVRQTLKDVPNLSSRLTGAGAGAVAYRASMQKDLWDLMSSLPGGPSDDRVLTGLEQQPTGYAAGATSYSAKSSSIFGMLAQMRDTFEKDLSSAQRTEVQAEIGFQKLRSAKEAELQAAGEALERKTGELADSDEKHAQAKVSLEEAEAALSAHQKFLLQLGEKCSTAESDYNERAATRQDEIAAIGEAINILTADDARDLFSKTMSFVQVSAGKGRQRVLQSRRGADEQLQARMALAGRTKERSRAASRLLAAARRHSASSGGWRLATLAVGVQLDGFEKVKELMDKMIVELKKQQQSEYEKHESCNKDIDTNEDETRVAVRDKKDLEGQIAGLEATLKQLTAELAELNDSIAQAHMQLKRASEDRKAENHEFQQVVADQRATVEILTKALDRLSAFYSKSASFAATAGRARQGAAQEPQLPETGKAYSQHGSAGGVLQMLGKVIQDAKKADQEAVAAEQSSQEEYSKLVANINDELEVSQQAITQKTAAKERAEADKLIASKDLRAKEASIAELADESKALHLNCDYLVKNFNIRQKGRQEEIEAIQEAKAILSGADLGGEDAA